MAIGRMEEKRHEFLEDVATAVSEQLLELGIPEKASDLVANNIADMLAERWGGQNMLIPKDYRRKLSEREAEIYNLFTGHNVDVLARQYGLSERGMRKLINRVRDRLKRQAQGRPDLFSAA